MENLSCTSVDCLVVGAGPAGLAATLYLRRFHRQVMLADSGLSRAMRIDRSHNMPGFPEGISGKALLVRLRKQVAEAKGAVTRAEVSALARDGENGFTAIVGGRPVSARQVVLATGVVDREPPLPGLPSVRRRGLLRHCPVCDGYEHSGQRILVLGDGAHARAEARFLSHYSRHVTLVGVEAPATNAEPAERPSTAVLNSMVQRVGLRPEGGLAVQLQDGTRHPFDVMYMAMGVKPRHGLATALGARLDADDNLEVDSHCRTSVPGLYAIGDVVGGLDQLVVATAQGAIAATTVHNSL